MVKATVNKKAEFTIDKNLVNGKENEWDLVEFRYLVDLLFNTNEETVL